MKATYMPRTAPSREVLLEDLDWRSVIGLLGEGGFSLSKEDRATLRRRVEDALRKRGSDNLLIELGVRLGVRMD